jgi:mono/diheme cytochrome c family protein
MNLHRRWIPMLALAGTLLLSRPIMAAELIVNLGHEMRLTTEALLARPDVRTLEVPGDVAYQRTMTYRAVPLRALLGVKALPAGEDLQIVASDGFVTTLPAALVFDDKPNGAVPWLAIEPPGKPWPKTPGGQATGPFYLVWIHPSASGVKSEQWPYQVASMRTVAAHAARWPQLAVGDDVPGDSPIRKGATVFATQCMVCHRMNGAGDASLGPDLNLPHNPTEYFQPWALRALIRDPGSVRAWPDMKMHGFAPAALSDADLDAIIAYLKYMSARRSSP